MDRNSYARLGATSAILGCLGVGYAAVTLPADIQWTSVDLITPEQAHKQYPDGIPKGVYTNIDDVLTNTFSIKGDASIAYTPKGTIKKGVNVHVGIGTFSTAQSGYVDINDRYVCLSGVSSSSSVIEAPFLARETIGLYTDNVTLKGSPSVDASAVVLGDFQCDSCIVNSPMQINTAYDVSITNAQFNVSSGYALNITYHPPLSKDENTITLRGNLFNGGNAIRTSAVIDAGTIRGDNEFSSCVSVIRDLTSISDMQSLVGNAWVVPETNPISKDGTTYHRALQTAEEVIDYNGGALVSSNVPRTREQLISWVGQPLQYSPNGNTDMDHDGIADIYDEDIDGDGYSNTYETSVGTNPYDSSSHPPAHGLSATNYFTTGLMMALIGIVSIKKIFKRDLNKHR